MSAQPGIVKTRPHCSLLPIKERALQGPSSSLILPSQELWEVTLQQDSFASLTIPALCSARVISVKRRHQQGLHVFIQSSSQGRCKRRLQQEFIACSNLLLKRSASKAHFPPFKPSAQGLCKASRLHPPWSILLLKGSARLQQGFTPLIQTFFIRAQQGFSKASLSSFKPSSQGLYKASVRLHSLYSNLLLKGSARLQ